MGVRSDQLGVHPQVGEIRCAASDFAPARDPRGIYGAGWPQRKSYERAQADRYGRVMYFDRQGEPITSEQWGELRHGDDADDVPAAVRISTTR